MIRVKNEYFKVEEGGEKYDEAFNRKRLKRGKRINADP